MRRPALEAMHEDAMVCAAVGGLLDELTADELRAVLQIVRAVKARRGQTANGTHPLADFLQQNKETVAGWSSALRTWESPK